MCTNLTLQNQYGPLVSARTMDFLNTVRNNVDFVPRGQKLPMAALGRRIAWKNQYGFIGIHTTLPDKTASGYVDG